MNNLPSLPHCSLYLVLTYSQSLLQSLKTIHKFHFNQNPQAWWAIFKAPWAPELPHQTNLISLNIGGDDNIVDWVWNKCKSKGQNISNVMIKRRATLVITRSTMYFHAITSQDSPILTPSPHKIVLHYHLHRSSTAFYLNGINFTNPDD